MYMAVQGAHAHALQCTLATDMCFAFCAYHTIMHGGAEHAVQTSNKVSQYMLHGSHDTKIVSFEASCCLSELLSHAPGGSLFLFVNFWAVIVSLLRIHGMQF